MNQYVSPEEAQLVYDPWVCQWMQSFVDAFSFGIGLIIIMLLGIFLMQLVLLIRRDHPSEHPPDSPKPHPPT